MSDITEGPEGTQCYIRHTIMDGQVRSYAAAWGDDGSRAIGPFEVSASRNAVMVHHANLRGAEDISLFEACLSQAVADMRMLYSCDGRPNAD